MERIRRTARRHLRRARGVERFVRLIVGGGVTLVTGLWMVTLARVWSLPWMLGMLFALLGIGGLVRGIRSEIDH